jgi:hypothetical protein
MKGLPMLARVILVLASTAISLLMAVTAALAATNCTRLGFSVNDYGKDGPARDAQDLLDKHIVKWAAEQGIKKYTVGKKDVSCELFLNFIVFDEHTCTASASVCWDGPAIPAQTMSKAPARAPTTGTIAKPASPSAVKPKAVNATAPAQ